MAENAQLAELFPALELRFPGKISVLPEFRGETTWVVDRSVLHDVLHALKQDAGFDYLVDLSSVDNSVVATRAGSGTEPRFELVYELFSYKTHVHLRVKTALPEDEEVPTVSDIWRTANWHEREVYDMMGIKFTGHPDLRRILMWEGYPYHPLLKEFPLEGKTTELPDIAFTRTAPLEGGPFVTAPADNALHREPRSRCPDPV
jgi:NADH-quinone oxidoreductase subunit C